VTNEGAGGVDPVMRLAFLFPLALVVAACGSATAAQPSGKAPAAGSNGPPPAWIETKAGNRWLGFSSYCWSHRKGSGSTGVCADMAVPKCSQRSVPNLSVESGERVRAHLGYKPEEASVEDVDTKLKGRIVVWRISRPGPFLLFTRGRGGDATYTGCAVLP